MNETILRIGEKQESHQHFFGPYYMTGNCYLIEYIHTFHKKYMIITHLDFNPDWLRCMATECGVVLGV